MPDKNVLETGEILQDDDADRALKEDLLSLAKNINVRESSSDKVDALFGKLDSVDAEAKNRALQYALKNAKIMVGNVEKSISDISTAFSRATEQEWSTWRIKVKEWANEDDKALVEWFLNEKGSSLAYLIQLSSRSASLQASRWYWRQNAEGLVDVGVDKIFWNQTRRALAWLRDWVQWDYTKNVESMDVKKFTVEDVLKLKFISSTLKTKIQNEAEDENVKNLWSDENYELMNKYTNNYALKRKSEGDDLKLTDDDIVDDVNNIEYTKSTPEFTSDNITPEEMQSYVEAIKTQCEDELKISDWESIGLSFEGKKLVFTLGWTWEYINDGDTLEEYIISETKDVKTCLKWWDTEDDEYGNVDIEYVKNSVIREVKESMVNQKKAIRWRQELVKNYTKNWFTVEDIFGWDSVLENQRKEWRLNTFFSKFRGKKLIIDSDTNYNKDKIRLEFNDRWANKRYNKWKNNSDLEFAASEIVNDDYSIDENKFKEKLKRIILNIIEREDFK